MDCKLAVICKFCQPEFGPVPVKVVGGGSITERPEKIAYLCKKCEFTCDEKGVLMYHYRSQHPKAITKTIGERPGVKVRHCKKCDFVSTGKSEGESKAQIMAHCKKEHPKERPAARGHYKPRVGKELKTGFAPMTEEPDNKLQINKDADVEHAFEILLTRSNESTLSAAEQNIFDKLQKRTEKFEAVRDWPNALRATVIMLFNNVVSGVLEDVTDKDNG